jgi:hypothetical protein
MRLAARVNTPSTDPSERSKNSPSASGLDDRTSSSVVSGLFNQKWSGVPPVNRSESAGSISTASENEDTAVSGKNAARDAEWTSPDRNAALVSSVTRASGKPQEPPAGWSKHWPAANGVFPAGDPRGRFTRGGFAHIRPSEKSPRSVAVEADPGRRSRGGTLLPRAAEAAGANPGCLTRPHHCGDRGSIQGVRCNPGRQTPGPLLAGEGGRGARAGQPAFPPGHQTSGRGDPLPGVHAGSRVAGDEDRSTANRAAGGEVETGLRQLCVGF